MRRLNYYHYLVRDLLDDISDLSHECLDLSCFYYQDFKEHGSEVAEKVAMAYESMEEWLDNLYDKYFQVLREHETISKESKVIL